MPNTIAHSLVNTELEAQQITVDTATTQVERFLAGSAYPPTTNVIVEEVLFNHALEHSIVYAGRALRDLLQDQGLRAKLQYCNSPAHGHPIPFLIVRDANGGFVVPTALDRRESVSDCDLVVVDGSTNYKKIPTPKAHLEVCPSIKAVHRPGQAKYPQRTRIALARATLQPNAIVILPSLLRSR